MKLFTFKLGNDDFGIESKYVYRVFDDVLITPVCLMPPFYLGLLYNRGELFDVIDLGVLMEKDAPFQVNTPPLEKDAVNHKMNGPKNPSYQGPKIILKNLAASHEECSAVRQCFAAGNFHRKEFCLI